MTNISVLKKIKLLFLSDEFETAVRGYEDEIERLHRKLQKKDQNIDILVRYHEAKVSQLERTIHELNQSRSVAEVG